jgi:hypothetical protein
MQTDENNKMRMNVGEDRGLVIRFTKKLQILRVLEMAQLCNK